MSNTHTVGIREFRENLHKYGKDDSTPITVTSHGHTVGFYVPAKSEPKQESFKNLKNMVSSIASWLEDSGISEDEIIEDFKKIRSKKRTSYVASDYESKKENHTGC